MNDIDEFYPQISYALLGCQLVEQELKLYISEALDYVKKCIGARLPFKMRGQDYEDSSLERLIAIFSKLTDNDSLVNELNRFKLERNFLSHKGIAHCLDPLGDLGEISTAEFMPRLRAIQLEAQRLRSSIHDSGNSFRAYLYFGNPPK